MAVSDTVALTSTAARIAASADTSSVSRNGLPEFYSSSAFPLAGGTRTMTTRMPAAPCLADWDWYQEGAPAWPPRHCTG